MVRLLRKMAEDPSYEVIRNYKTITALQRDIWKPSEKRAFLGLSLTSDGNLLAADVDNVEVCIINRNGKLLHTFKATQNVAIGGIDVFSNGNVVLSDPSHASVNVYTPKGDFVRQFGSAELKHPLGLAVDREDQVFIVEQSNAMIYVYKETGELQYSFNLEVEEVAVVIPERVCISAEELVHVTERDKDVICVYQSNGKYVRMYGGGIVRGDTGIGATPDGYVVVSSSTYRKISIFNTSGECVHEVINDACKPFGGVVIDDAGNIFASCPSSNCRIVVF